MFTKEETGAAIHDLRKKRHLTQGQLAEAIGVDQTTIGKIEKKGTKTATLKKIAEALSCSVSELLGEQPFENVSKPDRNITLHIKRFAPTLKVCAGDGNGVDGVEPEIDGFVNITDGNLAAMYDENNLSALCVDGDSMEPEMYDGDTVVYVDAFECTAQGMPYIVEFCGRLAVKAVERNKKGYLLRSANKNYAPRQITEDDNFRIVGRVVYIQPKGRAPKVIM